MFRHLRALQQLSRRTISSSAVRRVENKVPLKQKLFQADNDLPVHLKGGPVDKFLYLVTMGFTIFGTSYAVYFLYDAAMPKKNN